MRNLIAWGMAIGVLSFMLSACGTQTVCDQATDLLRECVFYVDTSEEELECEEGSANACAAHCMIDNFDCALWDPAADPTDDDYPTEMMTDLGECLSDC